MSFLVFCVEGRAERALLECLAPRILPDEYGFQIIQFEGKQDMEKRLLGRMRGWRSPNTAFVILRDQDSADCEDVKIKLTNICQKSGRESFLVRIACHELETFYLGDLTAVERGLGIKGIAREQSRAKFRVPDSVAAPCEELKRLTRGKFQKLKGARAIAPHLNLEANSSSSFGHLLRGIERLIGNLP